MLQGRWPRSTPPVPAYAPIVRLFRGPKLRPQHPITPRSRSRSGRFSWSEVVVRGRIELPTFRFSEGLYSPGHLELSTALTPRCLQKDFDVRITLALVPTCAGNAVYPWVSCGGPHRGAGLVGFLWGRGHAAQRGSPAARSAWATPTARCAGQDLIAVRRLSLARRARHSDERVNPVTALLPRPRIRGGEYSPTAPADTGQHPEHQPPADSGTHNGG